jgi:hypothetical protein
MEELHLNHLELLELRELLNKEVAELHHLKTNNWQPEKVDYDEVKPKMLKEIASKLNISLSEAEKVWEFIRYGIY